MNETKVVTIRENLTQVRDQIAASARSVGREPASISLVVVTKNHPLEAILSAIAAGVDKIGENYVDEALAKMDGLGEQAELEWHMIGHVQSRKARLVSARFDVLHSLDSLKLAARLDRFGAEYGRRLPVLLECNMSGETTKFGWSASEKSHWPELEQDISKIIRFSNLELRGLMTMAPYFDQAELARPYFRQLRLLRDHLANRFPEVSWQELSMGMSGDFPVAIQEGATLVRIGTAIMGARDYQNQ